MGSAAQSKVLPCLVEAQLSIHGQADFRSVLVLLAVVFPPAYGAQGQGAGCLQRLISATGATKSNLHSFHAALDEFQEGRVYTKGWPELGLIPIEFP